MTAKELYEYRKSLGMCVSCGDERAVMGKVRCVRCAQIHSVKQQVYEQGDRRKYYNEYRRTHLKQYREYQKRYREKEKQDYGW